MGSCANGGKREKGQKIPAPLSHPTVAINQVTTKGREARAPVVGRRVQDDEAPAEEVYEGAVTAETAVNQEVAASDAQGAIGLMSAINSLYVIIEYFLYVPICAKQDVLFKQDDYNFLLNFIIVVHKFNMFCYKLLSNDWKFLFQSLRMEYE